VSGLITCIVIFSLFVAALPAYATQTHKAPEGLYIHQLGHLLFLAAAAFLFSRLHRNPLLTGKGWNRIKISCAFFFLWNLYAFVGHILEELMPAPSFTGKAGVWHQVLAEAPARIGIPFYILKFDHLICMPAILFFFWGIKTLYEEQK
jgi:hypothetical protein